jgi:putative acetyltransferase
MHIRAATERDREDIRNVHLRAFPEEENRQVATLATELLDEQTQPETISLIAETASGEIVGHIAFSPVTITDNNGWIGYILAPLGIKPDYQQKRIGAQLIETGLQQLTEMGVNTVMVYGDPKYYGRFGFNTEVVSRYSPPYPLQYPFGWQATNLTKEMLIDPVVQIACVEPLNDPGLW